MCGIAGFVSDEPAGEMRPALERVQRALAHRGPDHRGHWVSPGTHAAFAHTRLSVLDPTPAGHQPMSACRRFTITYNGEIYNFAALRARLAQSGVAFQSATDTEVILRSYERDGVAFVEQLRGMFALAIWDEKERTCFVARDRFGIKPLYYHHVDGVLRFASEVRALLAAGVPASVDATAAYQYFRTGSVPEPMTLIQDVRALEAGHYMVWRDGRLAVRKYWEVSFPGATAIRDAASVTREALLDSVAHHFISDVPVGIFLSGGMDSTALVALARAHRSGPLRTFSLSFPGTRIDEGPEARRTAAAFRTEHHECTLDVEGGRRLFERFLVAADQPSIDGFNTFVVCNLARQHDTKVVLSGLGGDELFGGYPSFRNVPRLARIGRLAQLGGAISDAAVRVAGEVYGSRIARLADLLDGPPTLENAYAVFRGIYTHGEALELTRHYVDRPVVNDAPTTPIADPTVEDGVSRLELTRYMRNQLLRDSDVMSMAFGVELRTPFIDSVLFERLSRIPAEQRLQRGKALLYQAVPEIPVWVARRPKRGFVLPFERWVEHDWADRMAGIDPPRGVKLDTWYRKLSLLAFEQWRQRMVPQHV